MDGGGLVQQTTTTQQQQQAEDKKTRVVRFSVLLCAPEDQKHKFRKFVIDSFILQIRFIHFFVIVGCCNSLEECCSSITSKKSKKQSLDIVHQNGICIEDHRKLETCHCN